MGHRTQLSWLKELNTQQDWGFLFGGTWSTTRSTAVMWQPNIFTINRCSEVSLEATLFWLLIRWQRFTKIYTWKSQRIGTKFLDFWTVYVHLRMVGIVFSGYGMVVKMFVLTSPQSPHSLLTCRVSCCLSYCDVWHLSLRLKSAFQTSAAQTLDRLPAPGCPCTSRTCGMKV